MEGKHAGMLPVQEESQIADLTRDRNMLGEGNRINTTAAWNGG